MKKISFALAIAAAMSFVVACDKPSGGEDTPVNPNDTTEVVNPDDYTTFTVVKDHQTIGVEGGQVEFQYVFPDKPTAEDGHFTVNLDNIPWLSNFVATEDYLYVNVAENVGAEREAALVVQYRYEGSKVIEDSIFIYQEGAPYDVYLEAHYCEGEYYEDYEATAGVDTWQVRFSDKGHTTKGSAMFVLPMFTSEEPALTRDSIVAGYGRRVYIDALYEGTYVWEEGTYGEYYPMTISQYAFYGVFQDYSQGYTDQHWFTFGSLKITWLNDNGTQFLAEGTFTGDDGLDYALHYEGRIQDLIWRNKHLE
ncbi:MAG TPA: hypothetical protein IAC04_05035 [Candidatus Coprenecus stercoravium]|uniref:Lipoprotein n=1 Tax=Candidatus Coprenecus stercoravium TaxID=2840735 RepID=A0A9D2K9F5_9BACT|nr:hypothetical protein [Candidatus Coprenecus stercoravium]